MNNEMKVSTGSCLVVDDHGMACSYCSISSVKIEDGRLILRAEGGNIIASFSSWKSSRMLHTPIKLVETNENL
jgi:hypothetical protein